MPVPRNRGDEAFFRPLAGLELRADTALYLGLVHEGVPGGNPRKLAQAGKFAAVSGIAAECCIMTNGKLGVSIRGVATALFPNDQEHGCLFTNRMSENGN